MGAHGRLKTSSLIGVVAILAAGCTGGPGGGDKAGGGDELVVLTMANGYGSLDSEPAVAWFVKRVGELSRGDLQIRVVDNWVKDSAPEFEQMIVRDAASGKADLAWVGTRVFDTLGVESFRALTAPMLIDSYSLQQAVIEGDIPGQMLKALHQLNVVGLAVLADGLRKPVAVQKPLLDVADWQGIGFAAIRSQGQAEAIRALGAQPSDVWSHPLEQALDDGRIQGLERSITAYQLGNVQAWAPYVTVNVNLWPQTVALLANPGRLAGMTAERQAWVRQAAAEAAAHSSSLADREAEAIPVLCEAGARFANASGANLAALRVAFAPVYAHLDEDPPTRTFIGQIQQLKLSTPTTPAPAIPNECTGPAPGHESPGGGGVEPEAKIPDGVYRADVSEQFLQEAGLTATDARNNAGIVTITLEGERMTIRTKSDHDTIPDCATDVTYDGDRVTFSGDRVAECGTAAGRVLFSAVWTLANGELQFTEIEPDALFERAYFGGKSFKKIG